MPSLIPRVAAAQAGAHNHKTTLLRESQPPPCQNNDRRGVWVPACAGTTEQASALPRRLSPGVCHLVVPLLGRGRRESRAPTAPAVPCAKVDEKAHGLNYRYSQDIPAFPAQWLYGLYVLSPGKRPFLPPLPAGETPADVAPGSRRQDHTTSPYAAAFSSGMRTCLTPQRPSPPKPNVP
jgi:hypothetical protein